MLDESVADSRGVQLCGPGREIFSMVSALDWGRFRRNDVLPPSLYAQKQVQIQSFIFTMQRFVLIPTLLERVNPLPPLVREAHGDRAYPTLNGGHGSVPEALYLKENPLSRNWASKYAWSLTGDVHCHPSNLAQKSHVFTDHFARHKLTASLIYRIEWIIEGLWPNYRVCFGSVLTPDSN